MKAGGAWEAGAAAVGARSRPTHCLQKGTGALGCTALLCQLHVCISRCTQILPARLAAAPAAAEHQAAEGREAGSQHPAAAGRGGQAEHTPAGAAHLHAGWVGLQPRHRMPEGQPVLGPALAVADQGAPCGRMATTQLAHRLWPVWEAPVPLDRRKSCRPQPPASVGAAAVCRLVQG